MANQRPSFPSEDHKRGFDGQMLRDKIDFYLLEIFHKHFSRNPATLFRELKTHESKLNGIRGRIMKEDQWELIFPTSGLTDSKKFDATLTFLLIRNLCRYVMPQTGWGQEPEPGDTTEIADGIRLRLTRNKIQHSRLGLTQLEYRALYKLVEQPLFRLGCPSNDLKQLTPSFKYNIPDATPNFVGRDIELQLIHDTFLGNPKPNGVVIAGIPGIGKSETVSQYAHRYAGEYDHIMFINGDSIEASVQDIAKILKLSNVTDIKVIVKLLEEYFRNEKVLFVYDNVTDNNTLGLGLIRDFDNIITTQIQNWGARYKKVTLDVWTKSQAQQYLANSELNQLEQGDPQLLADELGYHPLAIEHAVSFIEKSPITLQEYFTFLQSDRLRVLSEKVTLIQSGIKQSIFKSFLLTIQKLQTEEPEAFQLLSILGILDGSFIHQHLAQRFCKDKLQYIRLRQLLIDYSMIKTNQHVSEWDNVVTEYLTIHSLYQQAVIFFLDNQNLIHETFEKCMACLTNDDASDGYNFRKDNIQLSYLWKQSSLQNLMIKFFEENSILLQRFFSMGRNWHISFREMFVKIEEKHKNNRRNILLHYAKFFDVVVSLTTYNKKQYIPRITAMRSEINAYIDAGFERQNLLKHVDMIIDTHKELSPLTQFMSLIYNGMYTKLLKMFGGEDIIKGLCYKELRQYDLALQCLLPKPQAGIDGFLNPKVLISCCYILKGEVNRGIKLLELIPDLVKDNLIDIGRAFYDVGMYEKSRKHFDRFISYVPTDGPTGFNYGHTALDCFYKIMILSDDTVTHSQLMLSCNAFINMDVSKAANRPVEPPRFRWFLFEICSFIKINQVFRAFSQVDILLGIHKTHNLLRQICFRDAFFLASQWKMQGYFYKALMVYRIVEMIRQELNDIPELFLHDYNDVKVLNEIEFCSQKLSRIFSKFFK